MSGSISVHVLWLCACVNNNYGFIRNTPVLLGVGGTVNGVCDSLFPFHNGLWAVQVIITGSLLGCAGGWLLPGQKYNVSVGALKVWRVVTDRYSKQRSQNPSSSSSLLFLLDILQYRVLSLSPGFTLFFSSPSFRRGRVDVQPADRRDW